MRIEKDTAHILSGVRHGHTIGSPIAMTLANKDWKNWEEILPVVEGDPDKHKAVTSPRPGHADLAGALKYNFPDARYILERASARESAARVACGALAKMLLRALQHRGSQPRNPRRLGRTLPRGRLPGNRSPRQQGRSLPRLRRPRIRSPHESRSRRSPPHRRHHRRHLRGSRPRPPSRHRHPRQLGRAPRRPPRPGRHEPPGGQSRRARPRRHGSVIPRIPGPPTPSPTAAAT